MLYEEGQLTESQAQQIIGKKMVAMINFLNNWMRENGYCVMLHSTLKENVSSIISEEGLHYPIHETTDLRDEILGDCAISERNLDRLENWIKTNHRNGGYTTGFETYCPSATDTTVLSGQLCAKQLLEYNHRGASTTIIFCVPKKKPKKIGRENMYRVGFTQKYDPYLRRKIRGVLQKDGSVKFKSTYSYPMEGILFAFDRGRIKVKFNENFDETFYLDDTTPQKGIIKRGELLQGLRNLEQQFGKMEEDLEEVDNRKEYNMRVLARSYYDDNGNAISKEEYDRKYAEFVQAYQRKYENIVSVIVNQINGRCKTNKEKMILLFDYLTSSDMKYDLAGTNSNGRRATHPGYQFPPYGRYWLIDQDTKYPAILYKSGVCGSYSKTFEDICKRLNIPCKVVVGNAGMDHAWNVVLENGELKHIDIAYAIMNRKNKSKMNYFMKSFAELQQVCGNRTMNQNERKLIEELTPKMRVKNRTDSEKKEIRVISRNDGKMSGEKGKSR